MKRIWIILFLAPLFAAAQNKPLIVEGTAPNLYLTHTVAPKENFYSIGRLYNISPKEIAPFNKLEIEKGLNLGQVIRIPVNSNFSQDGAAAADEALVPLYHVVKEKEGLYRIGAAYNKLPVATLKKWNNISGDAVNNGTKLLVGYLKVKKELSALSSMANTAAVAVVPTPVKETVQPELVKKEPAKKPETKIVKEETVAAVKKEEKPVLTEPVAVKPAPVVVKREENPVTETRKSKNFNGGFFKNIFSEQAKGADLDNESGLAAVFKSTSGWEDGKYYCLLNEASPGTIVKVTSPATGKSVYAKVLDVMPAIKQNDGVLIRLSNAAAAELGQDAGKFDCTLSFTK